MWRASAKRVDREVQKFVAEKRARQPNQTPDGARTTPSLTEEASEQRNSADSDEEDRCGGESVADVH